MTTIRKYLTSIVDIRSGEGLLTLLMSLYYYVVLVTYYLLKPARDSLFLVNLGAAQLPLVFIITALFIAPITTVYSAAGRSMRLNRVIYLTSGLLIVNLVILRWMLTLDAAWAYYLFYVWVSIFGALTASQYWLFANAVFDPSQAKRLFSFLTLGGILGAMTGGEVTSFFVTRLGVETEDLLFFCMGFVALFAVFARWVWVVFQRDAGTRAPSKRTPRQEKKESIVQMYRMIRSSRHLMYLVGITALTMATASFVDYQFKTVSAAAFPEKEHLTSFLGVFYGRLSLVSLVLQVLFAYRLVRIVGVAGVVMFLPIGLALGSVFMLAVPGLLAAGLLRGADGAFRYSLDKTGRELLFLPVPLEVKKRTKVFIDMFVDRWFRGVAGGVLLLLTAVFGFGVRELSVVVLALVLAWIVLVVLVRTEYVNAFRAALARRELDPGQLSVNITDPATLSMLRDLLGSRNEREVVYALDILGDVGDASLVPDMQQLLAHPSADVRSRALGFIRATASRPDLPEVEALVADTDPEVRLAAMQIVTADGDGGGRLARYIEADDPRVAAAALRCAAGTRADLVTRAGVEALASGTGEVRVEVARALGVLADASYAGILRALGDDDEPGVAAAAVVAMGATGDRGYIPELVEMLAASYRRRHARAALVQYGNGVVGALGDYLSDERVDVFIRRNIPSVLSRIPTQESADALAASLSNVDVSLRFRVMKALNKLRSKYPDLTIAEGRVNDAFVDETRMYYEILQVTTVCRGSLDTPAGRLLNRALEERLEHNLERVFRVLGLHYPPNDIYNAYLGIVSSDRERRASAVEFLDNVLGQNLKKYLFPIIDRVSDEMTLERGRELFDVSITSSRDAVLSLIRGRDPWLRACAIFCCVGLDDPEVRAAVVAAGRDPDPLVRETAELALNSKG